MRVKQVRAYGGCLGTRRR